MGYRRQPKVYKLAFEDEPGLEVMARSVSVGELLQVMKLADAMTSMPDERKIAELFGWFVKRLVGWNLEAEDGTPVPANLKGLMAQDFDFALRLVLAWVQAVSSVTRPTLAPPNGTAPDGPNLMESSIPMAPPQTPVSASGM